MTDRQQKKLSVEGGNEKEPGRDKGTTAGEITVIEEMGNVCRLQTLKKKIMKIGIKPVFSEKLQVSFTINHKEMASKRTNVKRKKLNKIEAERLK